MLLKITCIAIGLMPIWAQAQAQENNRGVFGQPIMPGPSGVFIYAYDTSQRLPDNNTLFIISREEKGGGFKRLTTLSFPASAGELEKRMDKPLLEEILKNRRLSSAADLFTQLKAGRYDTLGLYIAAPAVLEALGMLYIDRQITHSDPTVSYKLEASSNGNTRLLYQRRLGEIRYTTYPLFRHYSRMASDSTVMVVWYAVGKLAPLAAVFSSVNNKAFAGSVRTLTYTRRDTIFVAYSAAVTPGDQLALFVRPTDMAGNIGYPSDTVHLLALSFNNTASVQNLKATDTLGGILLHWDSLPAKAYYSGIRVLKSRSANGHFIVLDTLSPGATSFLDRQLLTGTLYYYAVEPVLYRLPQRGKVTPALVTALAKARARKITAPQPLIPTLTGDGNIRISWQPSPELNLFAYYVLRGSSRDSMKVISPAIRDTVYIDSLQHLNAGTTYLYAVSAMSMDMQWSDTSATVSVLPPKARLVTAPGGLLARFTEQGVKLRWNDVSRTDASVVGYMLYKRKKGDRYFSPLTATIIRGEYFTDTAISRAGAYEYGCTATDAWGNQSLVSTLAEVNIMGSTWLNPPADFSLRNLAAGIEINVPPAADAHVAQNKYIIYRRSIANRTYRKIGEVTAGNSLFIDRQVVDQQLYAYAVSTKQQELESKRTSEKTIRRK